LADGARPAADPQEHHAELGSDTQTP
jgi:hypothetical protein